MRAGWIRRKCSHGSANTLQPITSADCGMAEHLQASVPRLASEMDRYPTEQPTFEGMEEQLLFDLRRLRRSARCEVADSKTTSTPLAFGQRVADSVAGIMGSWAFIIVQSVALLAWVSSNIVLATRAWDPYPFILLNLALSFQAAYAAPVIMMSQNRQQDIDRRAAENDYQINIEAELEIELLHQKIDRLRGQELRRLTEAVHCLTELLIKSTQSGSNTPPSTSEFRDGVSAQSSSGPCRA
jgi:uncharacterized membrane protein